MPRARKRKKEEENIDTEAWQRTYGDMVTLLLTFFVLLYSMSTIDDATFEQIMISLHESFSGVLSEGRTQVPPENMKDISKEIPEDVGDDMAEEIEDMQDMYAQFEEYIEEQELEDVMSIMMDERGLLLRFQDKILFDTAEADLREEAEGVLSDVALILEQVDNEVSIEGHTDDRPISTERFPTNWELSTERATSVLRFLVEENDLEAYRFFATGYGEYRPIVPNDSPENMQLNRRVDITVLWSAFEREEIMDRGPEEDLVDIDEWMEDIGEKEKDLEDVEEILEEGG